MPGPLTIPVQGDETLPARVDVVVIGGGIIGAATALELAERGLRVALCEKGGIGHEQSSRNWGWVRMAARDAREIPLMAEALRLWPGLAARTGRDLGYTQKGIAFACPSAERVAAFERWMPLLEPHQISGRIVTAAEFQDLYPGCVAPPRAAFHVPGDGRAEPQKAAPAIAEAARDRGAVVLTECAVRTVETAAGRVAGVMTERGPITCEAVVLAGGAWSRLFAGCFGLDLPQLKLLNTVMRTEPLEGGPEGAFWSAGYAFRHRQDGGYTVANGALNVAELTPDSVRLMRAFWPALRHEWADLKLRLGQRFVTEARMPRRWASDQITPFERCRVLDPAPYAGAVEPVLQALAQDFPVFGRARIAQAWAGYIDVTPDAIPVISGVESTPGFFIATGFSGHGFGIGPGAGRLMADLVTGSTPCVDPHAFRLSRFSDGTRMVLDEGF